MQRHAVSQVLSRWHQIWVSKSLCCPKLNEWLCSLEIRIFACTTQVVMKLSHCCILFLPEVAAE